MVVKGVALARVRVALATCVAGIALTAMAPAARAAPCDPTEVAELRAHLSAQSDKADTWNFAWRLTFTAASLGTLAVGLADPFPSLKHGLYASSGKAAIGALARWILPLRIRVPAAHDDACTDLAALRTEIRRVAKKQRSLFWMGHAGGIAVNLGGAAYVWYQDSLGKALLSIAVGYPVGVLSNYTMPRATWKLHREREPAWTVTTVTATPRDDGWMLSIAGAF
jgi:hypothetical protein